MITLYEMLEVSENASDEIIEKAYKVLAKKYHPDLQKTPEDKKSAEEKMKQLNEAYSTLSNKSKRDEYDKGLERLRKKEELQKQNSMYANTNTQSSQNSYYQASVRQNQTQNSNLRKQQITPEMRKAYRKQVFINKIKRIRNVGIAIVIMFTIIGILLSMPSVRHKIVKFCDENILIKPIIQLFIHE